ncbi:MAG: hypothetical protein QM817_31205 [Archangium sp.]
MKTDAPGIVLPLLVLLVCVPVVFLRVNDQQTALATAFSTLAVLALALGRGTNERIRRVRRQWWW